MKTLRHPRDLWLLYSTHVSFNSSYGEWIAYDGNLAMAEFSKEEVSRLIVAGLLTTEYKKDVEEMHILVALGILHTAPFRLINTPIAHAKFKPKVGEQHAYEVYCAAQK